MGAARAILEVGMKVRQVVELEVRLAELEKMIEEQNAAQPAGWRP